MVHVSSNVRENDIFVICIKRHNLSLFLGKMLYYLHPVTYNKNGEKKQHFSTTWLQIRILHTKTQLLFFKTWYICSNYFLTEHSFLISREVNFNTKLSFTLCTRWNATWINMHIYQGNCLKYKLMVNWHSNLQKIFENSSIILSIFQT